MDSSKPTESTFSTLNSLSLVEAADCSLESADADALADVDAILSVLTPVAVGESCWEEVRVSAAVTGSELGPSLDWCV